MIVYLIHIYDFSKKLECKMIDKKNLQFQLCRLPRLIQLKITSSDQNL